MAYVLKHQNELNESKDLFQQVFQEQKLSFTRNRNITTIRSILCTLKNLIFICDELGYEEEARKWTLELNSTVHAAKEEGER